MQVLRPYRLRYRRSRPEHDPQGDLYRGGQDVRPPDEPFHFHSRPDRHGDAEQHSPRWGRSCNRNIISRRGAEESCAVPCQHFTGPWRRQGFLQAYEVRNSTAQAWRDLQVPGNIFTSPEKKGKGFENTRKQARNRGKGRLFWRDGGRRVHERHNKRKNDGKKALISSSQVRSASSASRLRRSRDICL